MKILKLLLAVFVVALLFSQCKYSFIVPEEVPPVVDPGDPDAPQMSFATDIIPIFNSGNYCIACHTTGKQLPDLTAANAYSSLNTSRYINKTTPDQSKIYVHPNPANPGEHTQKKYSAAQAATVLLWIQQGAKNN